MTLRQLVSEARKRGASDLHLESGMPPAFRVAGQLASGPGALDGAALLAMAREVCGERGWAEFRQRRSFDGSRVVAGVRCRINVLQSARGVGLAVRLLGATQPSLERLNLHPDIGRLVDYPHGLVLVCGATGSGKSSTLAALVERINGGAPRHVLTLEQPIEYVFRPRRALIRQREVGCDTPSFEQGLLDALREDPDVLVVGEMREPETMRLTLAAAETGHLVLATLHASTVSEAISRITASFGGDTKHAIAAQLAGCLRAIVCQRLVWNQTAKRRVPELEMLTATEAVRHHIRQGLAHKAQQVLETGGSAGMWTIERYRRWLDERTRFHDGGGDPPAGPESPMVAPSSALPAPWREAETTTPDPDAAHEIPDDAGAISDLIAQIQGGA